MFDELSSRFEDAVKGLRGEAKISENNINDALKEVKKALLDADVSLSVVKDFVTDVKDKAVGQEVVRGDMDVFCKDYFLQHIRELHMEHSLI